MVTTSRDSGAGEYSHGTAWPSPSPQLAGALSWVRATAFFASVVIDGIIAPGSPAAGLAAGWRAVPAPRPGIGRFRGPRRRSRCRASDDFVGPGAGPAAGH